jgi:hypothetical protein
MRTLINGTDLLPHGVKFKEVSSSSVVFIDGNGTQVDITQLSDGFRSVLSMTFELIRQLVRCYGQDQVLRRLRIDDPIIELPGVVLIDEVDAHLHPTWQTRIGHWFMKVFPRMQFIVTTHSPLVCRASENGTIWRLASPGSGRLSEEITGIERNRLIHGNILDAYGTELFGKDVERSEDGRKLLDELAYLNMKSIRSKLTDEESTRLRDLKAMLPTSSERM